MTGKTLRAVFLRTFFIQATWNFERMQNLGFCYAMLPALRAIYKKEGELQAPLKRHLEFFNTHPYMASAVIGTVTRMEEDVKKGVISSDDVKMMKTAVMGSFGAIGDSFFWGAVRPFASLAAVLLAAFGLFLAPLIFLLLYNLPHMMIKAYGFYHGYHEGINVFDRIKNLNFQRLARNVKFAGVVLAGALLAFMAHSGSYVESFLMRGGGTLFLFGCLFWLIRRGVSVQLILYLFLLLSVGSAALI